MNTIWNKDQFNSLFNFCGTLQANATCGDSKIIIDGLGNSSDISVNLQYGESCTYQIISKCGYPKIEINRTDVDVVVASFPKFSDIKINDPNFDIKQFGKDFSKALSNAKDAINGKLEYTFGKGSNLAYNETCGDDRTIVVTVTNLNKPAAASSTTFEARMLAASQEKVGLTFSSTATPDSAFSLLASTFALLAFTLVFLF